jgi:RNA polymerase sigma-70 factor (ECF subfamily)
MHTTPVSLLQRLRQPSAQVAWSRFVELYTPIMFAWSRRCGLNETDAADLVQDVFAHLITRLPAFQYDRTRSFRSWLRTVLVNKWRDRQRRLENALPIAPSAALNALAEPDPIADFDEAEYRQHLVLRALQLMRADFRPASWQACWEVIVNDRTPADVAAELGMTVGAVHAARFRILARLRQELEGMLD